MAAKRKDLVGLLVRSDACVSSTNVPQAQRAVPRTAHGQRRTEGGASAHAASGRGVRAELARAGGGRSTVGVQLVTCAAHAAFRLATARMLAIAAAFVVAHVLSFVFFLYVACSRGFSLLTALSLVRGAKRGEFLLYVYFLFAAAVLQLLQ